ncbi:MAG TPA: adenylate/guanylate cyclase domain-containing protein [Candidatus Limnocylindrales bacterium]|nr:adenylate/guanylate cyclase domain-containing protein [Candidatus Limnocylindrales bacterium]
MPTNDDMDWKAMLEGTHPEYRRFRQFFRRLPSSPRCKMCYAPFVGPGAPFMRMIGRARLPNNPNYCTICMKWIESNRGGAEVVISLLFADVRGSTTLGELLTPSDFSALLNRFYSVAADSVIEHDGIVDKFVGDEIMAIFAVPYAGENHAGQAIAAARALIRATADIEVGGHRVPVGAGVHTGVAFVGAVGGEGSKADFTALGDTVNTTARLASAAAAGEVLVTVAAASAAGLAFDGAERRSLELRGRAEAVDVIVLREGVAAAAAGAAS